MVTVLLSFSDNLEAGWTGSGSGLDELISSNCINLHIIIAKLGLGFYRVEQKLTCNSSGTRPGCMLFDEEYIQLWNMAIMTATYTLEHTTSGFNLHSWKFL